MAHYSFFVYITTNLNRTVLYTGMTNDLVRRMQEHFDPRGQPEKFAGKYQCYNLIYWEHINTYVTPLLARRKLKIGDVKRKSF